MTPDGELLRRYTETNSEDAFTELARRHLDLVYSAALRQVNGDAHLAQDVAQSVFADLARKAAGLAGRQTLAGWLYTGAHYAAAKAVRAEQRRHTREQEAHAMQELLRDPGSNPDWEAIRPVLDTAMHELDEADREVILLRYFENQRHADIGEQFGLGENAARMRVERALEKLRIVLARRGVTTTAVALSAAVSANAVSVGPAGLAATLSTAALTGTTATIATQATMNWLNIKSITAIAAAAIAAGTGTYLVQQSGADQLRRQNENLTAQQEKLTSERDAALASATSNTEDFARLRKEQNELLRLRGEVGMLRRQAADVEKARKEASQPQPAPPQLLVTRSSTNATEVLPLHTRTFKFSPAAISNILNQAAAAAGTASSTNLLVDYLNANGIDVESSGGSAFWNERVGMLLFRTTESNLEKIDLLLQNLGAQN